MCDNKKKILTLTTLVFGVSLIFVILINIFELKMLRNTTDEIQIIGIFMGVKIFITIISFSICLRIIIILFNKEVNFDYMTGLCSRKKLFIDLNSLISKKSFFTLCYIDFNDFKHVNDMYGHKAGDMLLKEFARRICKLDRKRITGYRMGGDEFVVIIKDDYEVEECIEAILKTSVGNVKITSEDYAEISFDMGISKNDFISTADEILKTADSNMYSKKNQRKSITRVRTISSKEKN